MGLLQDAWAVFSILLPMVLAHPMCLKFSAPSKLLHKTNFCSQYQKFSCCNIPRIEDLEQQHDDILSQLNEPTADRCKSYLEAILCLECNPYAAHVFGIDNMQERKPFPGLCRNYCSEFYRECKILIPLITSDMNFIHSANDDEQAFCNLVKTNDPDYCYPDLLTNPALTGQLKLPRSSSESCLCLEPFADQLRNPLFLLMIPHDPDQRIFIAEQCGVVYIYYKNGTRLRDPFMDLTNTVLSTANLADERGFFSMAFHPDYLVNGQVYAYFSANWKNQHVTRISRFQVSDQNRNKVDQNSQAIILQQIQPSNNHNGGDILFGLDGYLYLFTGDGGGKENIESLNYAQNLSNWLGKALRIDVDVPSGSSQPYLVPPDNPFINRSDIKPEIYAYGLRNPWRCDVDEGDPETGADAGRILCGDVGFHAFEEIDIIEPGGNYGWNMREGMSCRNSSSKCRKLPDEVLPIHVYPHSEGKSVIGGHVYRGCLNPSLQGQYIFGDFMSGKLYKLIENKATGKWTDQRIYMCEDDLCNNGLVGEYARDILSFGEDEDGEIYLLTTSTASSLSTDGKVFKLVDPRERGKPAKCRSTKKGV